MKWLGGLLPPPLPPHPHPPPTWMNCYSITPSELTLPHPHPQHLLTGITFITVKHHNDIVTQPIRCKTPNQSRFPLARRMPVASACWIVVLNSLQCRRIFGAGALNNPSLLFEKSLHCRISLEWITVHKWTPVVESWTLVQTWVG